jgi:hypothetical protein
LWLIKVWFSASTFVLKSTPIANPRNVMPDAMATVQPSNIRADIGRQKRPKPTHHPTVSTVENLGQEKGNE